MTTIAVLAERSAHDETEGARWVEHTHVVIETVLSVDSALTHAESGIRGYASGRAEVLVAGVEPAVAQAQAGVRSLRGLTRDNPEQQRSLDALEPDLDRRIQTLRDRLGALRRVEPDPGVTDEAIRLSRSIQARLTQMIVAERSLLGSRRAQRQAQASRQRMVSLGGGVAGILLIAAAALLVMKEMRRAQRAEGDLYSKHRQLDSIIEGTTDPIYLKDIQSRYILANSACAQAAGADAREADRQDRGRPAPGRRGGRHHAARSGDPGGGHLPLPRGGGADPAASPGRSCRRRGPTGTPPRTSSASSASPRTSPRVASWRKRACAS